MSLSNGVNIAPYAFYGIKGRIKGEGMYKKRDKHKMML